MIKIKAIVHECTIPPEGDKNSTYTHMFKARISKSLFKADYFEIMVQSEMSVLGVQEVASIVQGNQDVLKRVFGIGVDAPEGALRSTYSRRFWHGMEGDTTFQSKIGDVSIQETTRSSLDSI